MSERRLMRWNNGDVMQALIQQHLPQIGESSEPDQRVNSFPFVVMYVLRSDGPQRSVLRVRPGLGRLGRRPHTDLPNMPTAAERTQSPTPIPSGVFQGIDISPSKGCKRVWRKTTKIQLLLSLFTSHVSLQDACSSGV